MSLPKSYVDELNTLNREIINKQPADVVQFCANYFNSRLEAERQELRASKAGAGSTSSWAASSASSSLSPSASGPADPISSSGSGFSFKSPGFAQSVSKDGSASASASAGNGPPAGSLFSSNYTPSSEPPTSAPDASSHHPHEHAAGTATFPINFNANRRTSVSAETITPGAFAGASTAKIPTHTLTADQLARLNKSVANNFLFSNLDEEALHLVLYALEEKHIKAGTTVISQGDEGDFFYIVENGSMDFYKDGEKVLTSGPGSCFGELALMYNAPRAATVIATSDSVLWALDRVTFRRILLDKTANKRSMYEEFLKEVPILKVLSSYELSKLADALSSEVYDAGSVVIKEGDTGDQFYLIESGQAEVTKAGEGKVQDLSKGDYFGEVALLNDLPRQATVTAVSKLKVATLGKDGFQRLLGPAVDVLKHRDPTHAH